MRGQLLVQRGYRAPKLIRVPKFLFSLNPQDFHAHAKSDDDNFECYVVLDGHGGSHAAVIVQEFMMKVRRGREEGLPTTLTTAYLRNCVPANLIRPRAKSNSPPPRTPTAPLPPTCSALSRCTVRTKPSFRATYSSSSRRQQTGRTKPRTTAGRPAPASSCREVSPFLKTLSLPHPNLTSPHLKLTNLLQPKP